jgi:hypothetical protein
MTDASDAAATDDGQPTVEQAALAAEAAVRGGTTPSHGYPAAASGGAASDEHPEIAVGAAFAGGFVLALLLKRLAR